MRGLAEAKGYPVVSSFSREFALPELLDLFQPVCVTCYPPGWHFSRELFAPSPRVKVLVCIRLVIKVSDLISRKTGASILEVFIYIYDL